MERFGGQSLQVGRGGTGEGPGSGPGIYFPDPKSTRRGKDERVGLNSASGNPVLHGGWGLGTPSYRETGDPAGVGGQGWWRLWGTVAITCQIGQGLGFPQDLEGGLAGAGLTCRVRRGLVVA